MVRAEGLEPPTSWFQARISAKLSYALNSISRIINADGACALPLLILSAVVCRRLRRLTHCVVASVGVEPTAYRLSSDCSTPELTRGMAERTGFEPAIFRIDNPVHLAAMRPLRFGSGGANRTRVGRRMRPAWGPTPSLRSTGAPGTVTIRPLKRFRLALIRLSYRRNIGVPGRIQTGVSSLCRRTPLLSATGTQHWWSQSELNRRHPACRAGTLPAELWPLYKKYFCGDG